jgi:DNA polymerase
VSSRRDSVLRELGLGPLWRLRDAAPGGDAPPPVEAAASVPLAGDGQSVPPAPQGSPSAAPISPPVRAVSPASPTLAVSEGRGAAIAAMGWQELRASVAACDACILCRERRQAVLGVGDVNADWLFVGEGPGADEDQQGEPFVGKAGQLLTRMIEAMGLRRDDVYIANVVKCRPPGNRNPEPDEIAACEPFLRAQIAAIRPRVIVALGKFAAQTLLRDPAPITRLRGGWREYEGVRLMPTFHPAYLLRSPAEKGKAWEDLKRVVHELGRTLPAR